MKNLAFELNQILLNYSKGNKKSAYLKLKKLSQKTANEKINFNLAIMEQDQGLNKMAKISYKKLIDVYNNKNAKINLYLLYIAEGNYLKALEIIDSILISELNNQSVLIDKAYVYFKINYLNKCLEICNFIIKNDKKNTKAINLIGRCFQNEKKYKKAEEKFLLGVSYDTKNIALLNSLGGLYFEIWDLIKAENFFKFALDQNPKSYQTLNNLAGYYLETNNSEKALEYYLRAIKIIPNEPTILNNLAKTYLSLNRIDEAEMYCLLALKQRNDDSFRKVLSIIHFKKLDFKKAWEYFDGRLGLNEFVKRNSSYQLIKDKLLLNRKIDPNKKLLIIREQGVGDEILYGSIYSDLLNNFKNTIIEADKRLIPLFNESFENKYKNNFVKLGYYSKNKKSINEFEQVLYAGSLGYYFRNSIKDFPIKNYLKVTNSEIVKAKKELRVFNKKFKIGLSWKSFNNLYSNQKSLDLIDFDFLIKSNEIDVLNLQYGDVSKEINNYNNKSISKINVLDNLDLFNDFIKIASILKNLDLFISTSNSTAHLAGALGVKTLLIKPFNQATFHYWNQPNNRTPWYNSIELIEKSEIYNNKLFEEKVFSILN